MNDFDTLEQFEVTQKMTRSSWKLELTCTACGETVCDVEPGDLLSVLANSADDHWRNTEHEKEE